LGTVTLGVLAFVFVTTPEIMDSIKTGITITEAHKIIEEHREESGALPSQEDGNRLIEDLEDRWGNALRYEVDGETYVIRSAGPDGEFGTADDIHF
ncbi:MAG: hypothetical protein ACYS6Z_00925, partial [Planctomycetota bacterium]